MTEKNLDLVMAQIEIGKAAKLSTKENVLEDEKVIEAVDKYKHIESMQNDEDDYCPECGRSLTYRKEFNNYHFKPMVSEDPIDEDNYCPECGRILPWKKEV